MPLGHCEQVLEARLEHSTVSGLPATSTSMHCLYRGCFYLISPRKLVPWQGQGSSKLSHAAMKAMPPKGASFPLDLSSLKATA